MPYRSPALAPLLGLLPAAALLLLPMPRPALAAPPVTGVVTETGQLLTSLSPPTPANGSYDFQFQLFSAATAGTQVGATQTLSALPVVDGVFYAEINFGAVIGTPGLYLQTSYRVAGTTTYTVQSPRKRLPQSGYADYATTAGYALTAGNAATAGTASVSNSTKALLTKALSAAVPAAGQVLTYNGTLWAPATPATGGGTYTAGAGLALSGSQFSIANGSVTSVMLGSGAVTSAALAASAVTPSALAAGSVTAPALAAGSVTAPAIGLPLALSASNSSPILSVTNAGSGDGGQFLTTGGTNGMYAESQKSGGHGVEGVAKTGSTADGVYGLSVNGAGVYGNSASGNGVVGLSTSGAGLNGFSSSGYGVSGSIPSAQGVLGGVVTIAAPIFGTGTGAVAVYGSDTSGPGNNLAAIVGVGSNNSGVIGISNDTRAAPNPAGAGLFGVGNNGNGVEAFSLNNSAIYCESSGTNYAGEFNGKVKIYNGGLSVSGDLGVGGAITAGTKDFKIDHPLDPEHKYLYHASVESDKMEDVYHGHVILDSNGAATVQMPAWFQALNGDFEYTLTCIGGFAPVYVSQEIANNRFGIAGGRPGLKVSWQVTGVRHDAFALAHPLEVEQDKPEGEQGLYQNPEAFGLDADKGVGYAKRHAHRPSTQPAQP